MVAKHEDGRYKMSNENLTEVSDYEFIANSNMIKILVTQI